MPGRGNSELIEVFRSRALTIGGPTTFQGQDFPYGEAWLRMILRINVALVVGTGTTALAEALMRVVRAIQFQTDRSEIICNARRAGCSTRSGYRRRARRRSRHVRRRVGDLLDHDADLVRRSADAEARGYDPRHAPLQQRRPARHHGDGRRSAWHRRHVVDHGDRGLLHRAAEGPAADEIRPLFYQEYGFRGPVDPPRSCRWISSAPTICPTSGSIISPATPRRPPACRSRATPRTR